jgi:magnesium transporter
MTTETPNTKSTRLTALRSVLEQGSMRHGQRMINSMHPAEIASLIESLPPAKREIVSSSMKKCAPN